MKGIKHFFQFILLVLLISVAVLAYSGWGKYNRAIKRLPIEQAAQKIRVKESFTPIEQISDTFIHAMVSVEDRRFYHHRGIDITGTCRAIYNDIKTFSLKEGGSSITQQLAKNMYFMGDDTPSRKAAEMIAALKLEQTFSKSEILELYFNIIYYGSGYYSVGEASHGYFGKVPSLLSDYEATLLAGLPNAPSAYSPDKNPQLAAKRQKTVLRAMVKNGYISEEEAKNISGQ